MNQTTQTTLDEFITVVQDTAELAVSIAKIETSKAEAASEKNTITWTAIFRPNRP